MLRFIRKSALRLFSWPLQISQADTVRLGKPGAVGVGSAGIVPPRGGHNQVPQTEWLKTTEVHPVTVKVAGRLTSSHRQGPLLLEAPATLCLPLRAAAGGLQSVAFSLPGSCMASGDFFTWPSSFLCLCVQMFLVLKTSVRGSGSILIQYDLMLT